MDSYQSFIGKSKYSRYIPKQKRREHFSETVDRYINFAKTKVNLPEKTIKELRNSIVSLRVMPSMRAMMTAGKALARNNIASYNCTYLAINDTKAFDEAMFILMSGCGVGFSVEQKHINKLPEVPEELEESDTILHTKDSKEGWARTFRILLAMLYSGEIPKVDLSKIRPAGSVLKIFGGRASGPAPFEDLIRFTINLFKNAVGRKLNSLECHDIMCKIGEIVISGGVRRSALISLTDLSDERMRLAKSGSWWESFGHRQLANISAVYSEKPDVGVFMEEWLSIYTSKSGERGIFNKVAVNNIVARNGRRDINHDFGCNPCSEILLRPFGVCNLSEVIGREDDTEESLEEKVRIATILGTIQSTYTHFPYLRKIWKNNAEEERLLGVSLTGIFDCKLLNNYKDPKLPARLEKLREIVLKTNIEYAKKFGIPISAACTTVKPSGNVSQLVDSSSGIHPRHDPFYIRRIRSDNKDPLTNFLIKNGVPSEPDVTNPRITTIFSFPKKSPQGAKCRSDITALEHLELWLIYQRHWCEHKPSITVSVKEHEWPEVGAWVWKHFDEVSGIAFLPFDGGIYRQAPYETITEEKYNELIKKMPKKLDWDDFHESQDNVEGAQELACTASSGCEV